MEDQQTKQEREGEGGREGKTEKARASWLLSPKREGGKGSGSTSHGPSQTHASSCQPAGEVPADTPPPPEILSRCLSP